LHASGVPTLFSTPLQQRFTSSETDKIKDKNNDKQKEKENQSFH